MVEEVQNMSFDESVEICNISTAEIQNISFDEDPQTCSSSAASSIIPLIDIADSGNFQREREAFTLDVAQLRHLGRI